MSLPERQPVTPARVFPAEADGHITPSSSSIEPVRIAWVQSATDPSVSVPVDARLLQPVERTPERNLAPAPLIDPRAQIILASGAASAPAGWGISKVLGGASQLLIAAGSGAGLWLVLGLLLAAKLPRGGNGGDTIHVTNNNRWWGHSTSPIK